MKSNSYPDSYNRRNRRAGTALISVLLLGGALCSRAQAQGTWTSGTSMPGTLYRAAGAVLDGKLYVAGGSVTSTGAPVNTLSVYDPATDTWSTKTPMPTARYGAVAVALNDSLYVIGGWDGGNYTGTVEVYDPVSNTWVVKPGGAISRKGAAAGVIGGKIYVVGGDDGWYRGEIEEYDPATDNWMFRQWGISRSFAVAGVINNKLYITGGTDGSYRTELEVYDPSTNFITNNTQTPTPRWGAVAGVFDDRLFVAGGASADHLATLEVYDPDTDSWLIKTPMPSNRSQAAGGIIDEYLYVAGGNNGSILSTLEIYGLKEPPSISVWQPTGVQGGNITISYDIFDAEEDTVGILAEYSTDDGTNWSTAAVTGDTSGIASGNYEGSLTWNSVTDLPDQEVDDIEFRITPRDTTGTGPSDTVLIDVDNRAPQSINVQANSGDSSLEFWFDEPVTESSAVNTVNYTITGSGGFTITGITPIEAWSENATNSLSPSRYHAGSAVLDGELYVVGGYSDEDYNYKSTLQVCNLSTGSWSTKASMSTPRQDPITAVINDELYVIGGQGNAGYVNTVEVYDPGTNSWTTKSSAPFSNTAWECQGEAINGKLYLYQNNRQIFVYDPHNDSWGSFSGGPGTGANGFNGVATAVIGGKLYIAGGWDPGTSSYRNNLVVVDPATQATDYLISSNMPTARQEAVAGAIDGRLYVFGGRNNNDVHVVEIYDPAGDSWTTGLQARTMNNESYNGEVVDGEFYFGRRETVGGGFQSLIFDVYSRNEYELTTDAGLPAPPAQVTLTATTGITDRAGNTIGTALAKSFTAATGNAPSISVYGPVGNIGGDVTIDHEVEDDEDNPVWLLAEYRLDGESTWNPATLDMAASDTTEIASGEYGGSLAWKSGTDLADQEQDELEFRITVRDNGTTWGGSDSALINVDNQTPQAISAEGPSGSSMLSFWFDEPVTEASATTTGNFTLSGGLTVNSISVFEEWTEQATSVPTVRHRPGVCSYNGLLWVIGGFDGTNYVKTVKYYEPGTGWSDAASMNYQREYPLVAGIDGKIYVLGGLNYSGNLSILEAYDIAGGTWSTRNPAPFIGRTDEEIEGGVIQGRWYINHGQGGIYIYDPKQDSWQNLPAQGLKNQRTAAGVIDGKLYLAGGRRNSDWQYSSELVVFDPETQSTATLQSMNIAREDPVGGVLDGKFYVVGGQSGAGWTDIVEIYDPSTTAWSTGMAAPDPGSEHEGAVVDGEFYFGRTFYGASNYTTFDVYCRDSYELMLGGGESLPAPPGTVTLTATSGGLTDWAGNTIATDLATPFTPSSGNAPAIAVYEPTGPRSGDVTINYIIDDDEDNPVWLLAEYQLQGESTWNPASSSSDTIEIPSGQYEGSLVWDSGTDLPGQDLKGVTFRIRVRDNGTSWGGSDNTLIYVDNLAPRTISAEGPSGGDRFMFRFDEPVTESSATTAGNYTVTGSTYTVNDINILERWLSDEISVPSVRNGIGTGVLDGKLYIVGGWDNTNYVKTVEAYDPDSGWDTGIAPMPTARHWPLVAGIEGKLYVLGGYNFTGGDLSLLEVYDPETNSWSTRNTPPFNGDASQELQGAVINGKWYINETYGGISVYDPEFDSWQNFSGGLRNESVTCAAIDGKLYLAGGQRTSDWTTTNDLVVFDPATNSTVTLTSMPTPRGLAVGGVLDGKFFVVGGNHAGGSVNTVEFYDPASLSWTAAMWSPEPSQEYTGAVLGGTLYFGTMPPGPSSRIAYSLYSRNSLELVLGSGEFLPAPPGTVTLTATTGITDWAGNTISAAIDTEFTPFSGNAPKIAVYQPTGVQSGDVTVDYMIDDDEDNPVWLLAEYRPSGGSTWTAAALDMAASDTIWIDSTAYEGSLVWKSGTDLSGQELNRVRFRIQVRDTDADWGGSGSALIDIDNRAPQWIEAEGTSGGNALRFRFNEPVSETTATEVINFEVTGSVFTVADIDPFEEWEADAFNLPTERENYGVGVLDGKLYFAGGRDGSSALSTVDIYDPLTNGWSSPAAAMSTPRDAPIVANINGRLYVIGGCDNFNNDLAGMDIYDPETDSWTYSSGPAIGANYDIVGAVIKGRLYLNDNNGMQVYDPQTDDWENFAGGLNHSGVSAGVIDGKLYLAGGYDNNTWNYMNDLVVFDPVTRKTTALTFMPTPKQYADGGVIDGKFYTVGGQNNSGDLDIVEIYDPVADSWSAAITAPHRNHSYTGAVSGGKFYFCGGWITTGYGNRMTYDVYSRDSYDLMLGSGETLPSPPSQVTITASGIADRRGNTITTALDTFFIPSSGDPPAIAIYRPSGMQSGDVPIGYSISDNEGNPVWLLAEYMLQDDGLWHAASLTADSDTTEIPSGQYDGTLTWKSADDLPDQTQSRVRFRITPRDNQTTWGASDQTMVDLDNRAPKWVLAEGDVDSSTFRFWFNEAVIEATATSTANISLSHGLTIDNITPLDEWSTDRVAAPTVREAVGVGALDGRLYVVGGWDGSTTVERYRRATDQWETLAPMPTPRKYPCVTTLDGLLYVLGGDDDYGEVRVLEIYDPESDSWSTAAPPTFNCSSSDIAAGAINGKLYVNHHYDGMYAYDPKTNSWENFSGGLQNQWVATTVIDGKLYIAGGWNPSGPWTSNELVVFDPDTRTTKWLASMPLARQHPLGAAIGGKFYVVGGSTDSGPTNAVEAYDPATDTWDFSLPPAPRALDRPLGAAITCRIYCGAPEWNGGGNVMEFDVYLRGRFQANLGGGLTLPFDRITLEASSIEDWYGNTAGTLTREFVPKDANDNPYITVFDISGEVSGAIDIGYSINDAENDLVRLIPDYSNDEGDSWIRATTSADTVNIAPSGYDGSITWYSASDLDGFDLEDVWFRLTPCDNTLERGGSDDIPLHVDNNDVPSATITGTSYSKTDTTWTFDYQLSDAESDTLSLQVEYSTDGGGIWSAATTPGSLVDIDASGYTGSVVWEIERDLPAAVLEAAFRITPGDNDPGTPDQTNVYLNALGVPTVTIDSTYSVEQTGDVTIPFTITDDESDPAGLYAEYLNTGGTWQAASVTGDTSALTTAEYSGTLVWNSTSDLGGEDIPNAGFRLTPYDANNGFDDEVYFYLDNNEIPTVSVDTPSSYQHRDVDITYTITDPEGDAIGLLALYSTDGGTSWIAMDVTGSDTTAIGSGNYIGTLTWNCFDDMGYGQWPSVMVKLMPHDLDAGIEGSTTAFSVENYVGDYSPDGTINGADFTALIAAYVSNDTYQNIGPASGTPPLLIPDTQFGEIDFEDLAVFIQMWNWSLGITAQQAEESPGALVKPTASQRQNRNHSVLLSEKIGDDPWATDTGVMDLELKASQVSGVMVTSIELTYDPEHLKFLSLEPGTFMGRPAGSKQSLIYLQNVDEEKGRMSLLLGRIDREDPDISGSGLLASLHFVKLSKENSLVTVAYEMWDREAELLVQDSYQTEVHALRIPGEFALLQNYPNPFNGDTVIRFQLPQAARVQMYVFNIRGQRVATLVDDDMDPGYHKITWNGRNDDNRKVASGIYIYLIQANRNRASQKLTIIK